MDQTEFINAYIETLTKNLHDTVTKNVMLETKVAIAEKTIATLTAELEAVNQQLEKVSKKTKSVDSFE